MSNPYTDASRTENHQPRQSNHHLRPQHDFETEEHHCESCSTEFSYEVRQTIRKVSMENTKLRSLLANL